VLRVVRLSTAISVLTVVAVWPSVEAAFLHGRDVSDRSLPISSRSLTATHNFPVSGSQSIPFGLRSPVANSRVAPVARSTSQMAARSFSISPFSPTLLFDPTVT
jgi:hypothetical protein